MASERTLRIRARRLEMEQMKSRLLRLRADFAPLVERAVIMRRIYQLLLDEMDDHNP